MGMLIGYARVSTGEQNLDLQIDALDAAGCERERIYTDEMSGVKAERPGLQEAWMQLRTGDTLVVWRLDRLGRSLKDLVNRIEELQQRGIGFRSLQEALDTTTAAGKLQFHVFSALAEFERELIRERTLAGLRAARARGRKGGRPKAMTPDEVRLAARLMSDPTLQVDEICTTLGVSRATPYRYVDPRREVRRARARGWLAKGPNRLTRLHTAGSEDGKRIADRFVRASPLFSNEAGGAILRHRCHSARRRPRKCSHLGPPLRQVTNSARQRLGRALTGDGLRVGSSSIACTNRTSWRGRRPNPK